MANMASVSYVIEGSKESLSAICQAICKAFNNKDKHWDEYAICINLGFSDKELEQFKLGGELLNSPSLGNSFIRFDTEERWGIQDFKTLLKHKFPDIKVYWIVEECGFEIYCTNDKEGKYFPERFWVDTCIDDSYNSEYFETKEQVYKWLNKLTLGRIKCEEDVTNFNADYENDGADENFIYVHEFDIDE